MLLQQQQSGLTKHDAPNEHHFLEWISGRDFF
jgi:hypothetical protein